MSEEYLDLDKRTKIPLWAVLVAVPTIVGFVFWLSTVANLGMATAKTVDKLEESIFKIRDDVAYLKAKAERDEKKR